MHEHKTPSKSTISPVMFKRFDMNRFPASHKKEEVVYLKTESKSPINFENLQSDYYQSPNHQLKEAPTSKILPQILLSRAQTQINSRKQTSHEGSSANVNQTFHTKQEKQQQQKINLNNPYQVTNHPSILHTPLQSSSGTGIIAHSTIHKKEQSLNSNQAHNMTFQENKLMNQSFQNDLSPKMQHSDLFSQNSKQIKSQQEYMKDSKTLYKQQIEKFKLLEEELKHMNSAVKESRKPKFNNQQNIFLQTLIKSNRKQMPALLDIKQRQ
ncbi:UNKNOWN [Stylonychia lemnae]|uniref:Uncharacterized protein n=1 Tax=Stylonychia lemnae TaxID=5949 RepID=A0A078A2P6_STYLE|nr:UNKNOWN [Stylonychia lemnae]|eukprot:CDW76365.1 UNKNOWN [Stylonychia lemnae]